MSDPTDAFNFREEMRKLVEDDSVDWDGAVLVLPAMRNVIFNSQSPLTAVGVVEWCKAGLLADHDENTDDESQCEGVRTIRQGVH